MQGCWIIDGERWTVDGERLGGRWTVDESYFVL